MKIVSLRLFKNREKSLDQILAGCRKGDASCQELLFQRYAPKIMTVCRRYEYPDFGASDILQESFLLIFKNISRFDPDKGSIEAWMKKIAVNTALKVIRQRKLNFLDIESHHIQLTAATENAVEESALSEEFLLKLIKELPDGYRTIFNLFVVENFSHKEIADMLDISVQTSKSQLSKAKKMLRMKIQMAKATRKNKNVRNY
ncbi:MAG: sigma-70 family RNA polymerase sigma factor [Bacteroidota bacterium]